MATIHLSIFVSDINNVVQAFDLIKIRRSIDGEFGEYHEITGTGKTSASLESSSAHEFDVGSKTLTLSLDQGPSQDILFDGSGVRTIDQVIDNINAVFPGSATSDDGKLRLISSLEGSRSKLVVGGTAAAEFGWNDGQSITGLEQHILLQQGVANYNFTDYDGDEHYWYSAAYLDEASGRVSAWSSPFKGAAGTVIDVLNRSMAFVDLVDATGTAVAGQRITFYSQHTPLQVESYQAALVRRPITIKTDNMGHAEISLIRGLILRVVFEGTALIREITVPDQDTFNLLEVMASAPDPYNPIDPQIPYAIRRST